MPSLATLLTEAAGGITINVGNSGAKKPAAKDDKKKPKKKPAKKGGGERDANRRLMDLLAHHDAHAGYHRTKAVEHHAHAEYHRLAKKDGHLGVINRQIADGHRGLVKLYHRLGDTLEAVLRRRPEDKGVKYDRAKGKQEALRKERAEKKGKKKPEKKRKRLKECLARFEAVTLTEAGRVTHTFGRRLSGANARARDNAQVPREEWHRRGEVARQKHAEARAEGEKRKDARGAYPRDVLRRMDAAQREMDAARQHGKWGTEQ